MVLIILLILIALVVIFAVQNAIPVTVSFFNWKFDASLAIVIFLSVLAGIIISAIIAFSRRIRRYIKKQD